MIPGCRYFSFCSEIRGCRSCSHHQGLPTGCACVQAIHTRLEAAASRVMKKKRTSFIYGTKNYCFTFVGRYSLLVSTRLSTVHVFLWISQLSATTDPLDFFSLPLHCVVHGRGKTNPYKPLRPPYSWSKVPSFICFPCFCKPL